MSLSPMPPVRVALITGSGRRRIGFHVAEALARRGYCVAIHYHSSVEAAARSVEDIQRLGVEAAGFQADLAADGAAERLVADVLARFGRIDVLVTCAAVWPRQRLEDVTAAEVRQCFEINALSTFVCCQHAGLAMTRQADGGAIVTIGDWAVERPYRDYAAYFVSKGTIPALTRMLAVELAERNPRVRVNCVLPGPVMVPADLPAAEREAAIRATLVKREGRPENIAQAVLHFIENDFVTGACLNVDGGRTVYAERWPA